LKDCERKHNTKDSKYETLADAINERVRDAVGENHWAQARKIQKQLVINQQRKKLRAMKGLARRSQSSSSGNQTSSSSAATTSSSSAASSAAAAKRPELKQASNEAMEAAVTMSALAQGSAHPPPSRDGASTPVQSNESRSNNNAFKSMTTANDVEMSDSGGGGPMRQPQFHGKSEEG